MKKWLKRCGYFLLMIFLLLNVICAFNGYKFSHYYDKKDITEASFGKRNIFGKISFVLFGPKFPKSEIKEKPAVPYKDTTLTTEEGVKLAAWYLRHGLTDSVRPKGTLLMFHGAASCRSSLVDEINAFYAMGWNVFTIDFRGNGQSDGYTTTFSYTEIKDVKTAYEFIQSTGEKKIAMFGESMGAACILRAVSVYKLQPYAIISDAAFGSILQAVEGRVRTMHLPAEPIATMMCFWGGLEEGYWSFGVKQTEYAKDITCPILVERGMIDERVTEKETQDIYKNLASADKKIVEYKDCGHESFYAKWPAEWLANVSGMLNR